MYKYSLQIISFYILLVILIVYLIYSFIINYKTINKELLVNKYALNRKSIWINVKNCNPSYLDIFPKTYIIPDDLDKFNNEHNQEYNKKYILKTLWSGKRVGIKLVDFKEIKDIYKDYSIIQEIEPSHTINNYVYNIRMFLIVKDNNYSIYNNGYLCYCAEKYDSNNITFNNIITSTFSENNNTDHLINNNLPLTLHEYVLRIGEDKNIFEKIKIAIDKLIKCTPDLFMNESENKINMNIFGIDILVTPNYNIKIIEVNSSPGLTNSSEKQCTFDNDFIIIQNIYNNKN